MKRVRFVPAAGWIGAFLLFSYLPADADEIPGPRAPTGLLLERLAEPLGIESPNPAMSWIVEHDEPDQYQTGYRVRVASRRALLEEGRADVWDSGPVRSEDSSNVRYAGPDLAPDGEYFWQVRIRDRDGRESPWSKPQRFVTAVGDRWHAVPIWAEAGEDGAEADFAFLRREFELPDRDIRSAVVHVTALSPEPAAQYVYRLYLNGTFVGCGPERGFAGIRRYNTYEVADLLKPGAANAVAALNYTAEERRFLLSMRVRFADGTEQILVSDESWRALDGSGIYVDGGNAGHDAYYHAPLEFINGPAYPFGWKAPGFDDAAWSPAVEKGSIDNLKASEQPNERKYLVAPARFVERGPGHYFIDFGRSVIGGFRLDGVVSEAGREVELRLGQELAGPREVRYNKRTGNTYREVWTLAGRTQTLTHWGYRSFRYAELIGAPEGLDETHVRAVVVRQPLDETESDFESSDRVLNDVWDMLKYSIRATGLDVYVDTHARERRNYEGDAYINQLSQYTFERQYAFPRYSMEYLYHRPTWPTEYKQISVMMAWNDYLYTGNADSLRKHYGLLREKTLEEFVNEDFLVEKEKDAGGRYGRDLVDWPRSLRDGYRFSPFNTVVNAFNYRAVRLLGRIAGVLGEEEDAAYYGELADNLAKAINDHFFDPETGAFRDGKGIDHHALHASVFPLALEAVRPEHVAPAAGHIAARGMRCNVYGAQFLLEALYRAGRGDAALSLMNAVEGNSWGHMMYRLGATIAGECWDPALKPNMSFSHGGWGSAPANNIARGLFGILPLEPGFARFRVKPQPGGLEWARIRKPTIRGPVEVEFADGEDWFVLTVSIPANTRATVYVPHPADEGTVAYVNGETREGRIADGYLVFDDVGSGAHRFATGR